ncbi:murein hydrolase activator EnvC family protein [Nitrospira moscoviensis]|uniref:Putative Murein hydrolase EnvC n=1 Tax=Nitrospira moscoviensis TaxID=42253 RepID=A0A0K2GG90_NITMO|nr:peptidoglycan DD-metalloendopeptidase family protein [Nitrospira moscoviensis]ALA59951.1 putative Murein hydrolase EnvC [Nitrospira moscoviensis]
MIRLAAAIGFCLALWSAGPPPVVAADPITDKIERERKALEQLKGKIEEKRKQADEAEKKRESVLQGIQSLDERLVRHRQDHHEINKKLRKKDREIQEITEQLGVMRAGIEERRKAILARLRVQYMEGRFGYVKALLAADSVGDFERRRQYLSAVSHKEYELLGSFKADVARMEQAERQRADARAGMVAFKESIERKLLDIRSLQKEKKAYLTKITQEKDSYNKAVEELERSASRVDSLLRELETRRKALAMKPPTAPGLPRGVKGSLPWPADGQVVSFFGRQKHPTFNTYVQRKGIEIRTTEGSFIHAVMPGTVVYADWLKGYGLVIIVDHANGFFSLYAHASKILTKVGEQVAEGHPIGETGDTGMIGENTLYFELREGAEAVDPLLWLAKR